jgi:hypothetical protein
MSKPAFILILIALFITINSYSQERTLEISGLRVYNEDELYNLLNLDLYEEGKMTSKEVIDSIIAFYSGNGFTLVKVYVTENTDTLLRIYIDEGALGKIIFLNMDDFTTLYLKIAFRLKHKIFNYNSVENNIQKLKSGGRWKDITWQLKPVKEYDSSLFQLDRALDLPLLGNKQLPFFDRYSPRYDLIIIFSKTIVPELEDRTFGKDKKPINDAAQKEREKKWKQEVDKLKKRVVLNKFDYGLRVHFYKGFIPYLRYYHLGLLSQGDFFLAETSLGLMYGIDRRFTRPPRLTYYNLNTNYFFTPTFKDIFTPLLKFDLFYSKVARPDIGLQEYQFLLLNGMLAPGITMLRKINVYTGFGVETAFFLQNKVFDIKLIDKSNQFNALKYNPTPILNGTYTSSDMKSYADLMRYKFKKKTLWRTDVYNYVEAGVLFDFTKKRSKVYELRKNRLKKEIAFLYDFYFLEKNFSKIRLLGYFEHEFKDRSIYSGIIHYQFMFGNTPFYHEASVSNPAFKGLSGLSYFSKNVISQSNEYRISVYKDFVYIGVFFDMTLFEGSGRDLRGMQFAFVGGPTARVLLLDHFELYLQYGWDYLLSTRRNHGYLYFNIQNKW